MVAAGSSNERPHIGIPTNTRPPSDPMYWSPYSDGTDDQPPAVPPKDPRHNPIYLSPVSTSFPPNNYARPRYTSFSVYEPQSASMAFPEPRPHRATSQRAVMTTTPPIRHRMSKSDFGLGASRESLWVSNSNRGSYAPTVLVLLDYTGHPCDSPSTSRNPLLRTKPVTPCTSNRVEITGYDRMRPFVTGWQPRRASDCSKKTGFPTRNRSGTALYRRKPRRW